MDKKTRLLFVITQGEMGGAQRYVFDVALNIADRHGHENTRTGTDYEIAVAIGKEGNGLENKLRSAGIPIFIIHNLVRNIHPLKDIAAAFELKKLINKFRPDIIHLNSSKAGVIGSLAAALAKNPNVIFTAHGFAFLEPHNWAVRQIYFWAEKFASHFRRQIITVSEYDRLAAIKSKLCPPDKLITIHNGIDSVTVNKSVLTTYNLQLNSYTIGTIAHDYPTKDLKTLRSAFAILKSEFPNLRLQIIGHGSQSGDVQDASQELSNFDIYVCSSVKEGFPYSILEAMRAGLPIVSTRAGGIPEAIENEKQGLLVEPKNPKILAMAIKRLILNPGLAGELGSAAKKKVQEFSLEKMINSTEAVYRNVVTG